MKAIDIHNLTDAELTAKLADLKNELFNLRFRHAAGQLSNPVSIRTCKRTSPESWAKSVPESLRRNRRK